MKKRIFPILLLMLTTLLLPSCGNSYKTGVNKVVDDGYDLCLTLLRYPNSAEFIRYYPTTDVMPMISEMCNLQFNSNWKCSCYEIEADKNSLGERERAFFYVLWYGEFPAYVNDVAYNNADGFDIYFRQASKMIGKDVREFVTYD